MPAAVAPPPGNPRFPLFDSLRAIAALSVFAAHSIAVAELTGSPRKYSGELSRTGVCIFFLVSGFLLYRPFVAARWRGEKPPATLDFARRRLLRIVPAYWLALAAVVAYFGDGVYSNNWWTFPAFGQIYRSATFGDGIGVAWTLCVEMSFYALLPLYALLARRLATRQDSPRADLVLLVILAAASLAFHAHYVNEGDYHLASTLPGTFYWFALGMGLSVASVAAAHSTTQPAALRIVIRQPTLCWILALAAFGVLLTQNQGSALTGSLREHVLCGVVAVLILLPAVFGDSQSGLPRRILALPALAWIGLISYGFYLWHYYALLLVERSSRLHPLAQHYILLVGLSFGGAIVVAAGSYYLLERPVLRLKHGRRRLGSVAWASTVALGLALFAAVGLASSANEPPVTCRIAQSAAPPAAEPARCRPPGYTGQTFSLGQHTLRSSNGRRIPVIAGEVSGNIDVAQLRGPSVEISGWAAHIPHRRPATAILIFADDRFVVAISPTVQRRDVSRAANAPLDDSGFKLEAPPAVFQRGPEQPKIKFYAVESGTGSQLLLHCGENPQQFGC